MCARTNRLLADFKNHPLQWQPDQIQNFFFNAELCACHLKRLDSSIKISPGGGEHWRAGWHTLWRLRIDEFGGIGKDSSRRRR